MQNVTHDVLLLGKVPPHPAVIPHNMANHRPPIPRADSRSAGFPNPQPAANPPALRPSLEMWRARIRISFLAHPDAHCRVTGHCRAWNARQLFTGVTNAGRSGTGRVH